MATFTQSELHKLLDYDPVTGIFKWKVVAGNKKYPGDEAGCPGKSGYLRIGINYQIFYNHRLAWFYVHGVWPKEIDHVDGNRQNNAIDNLRESTRSQNGANKGAQRNSRTGVKGVCKIKNLYRVYVGSKYIGYYRTVEEAQLAYFAAAQLKYGEFATAER